MKLWPSRDERRATAAARSPAVRRMRILIWASLISMLLGAVRFGDPLEAIPRAIRDQIRMHPSNGKVVVVAKDDASAAVLGAWPVSRRYDAKVIDNLFAAGAKRVFFDEVFAYPTNAADDNLLGATMAKYPGRVFVGLRVNTNRVTLKNEPLFPIEPIRRNAKIVSLFGYTSQITGNTLIPNTIKVDDHIYPSIAAELSGNFRQPDTSTSPDLSIRISSVPTVSFVNIEEQTNEVRSVKNRDVIIAPVSEALGDIHFIFPQGLIPGSYLEIIASETMKRGVYLDLGWYPTWLLSLIVAICNLIPVRRLSVIGWISALLIFMAIPFLFDLLSIRLALFPGAVLVIVVAIRASKLRRVLRMENTDQASGLPNLKLLQRDFAVTAAVIALKIRNFAEVAASLGGEGETRVVGEVAYRVRVAAPTITIYHSHDCLLWQSDLEAELLNEHLDGLHALFNLPVVIEGRSIDISVAFGIDSEIERSAAKRVATAHALADEASARGLRRNHSNPASHVDSDWRMSLLGRMDNALANGEIWVAYQPQLDLREDRIASAEALVRWTHPERGAIKPNEFVLAAEQGNRIDRLTYFVMERAIADAASINRRGSLFAISVNLSAKLLSDRHLIVNIEKILAKYELPPQLLTLEITESSQIERPVDANAVMRDMRERGINVSIDDYGTGFSTLEYLRSVPANEVKIDRQFIAAMSSEGTDRILVESTIGLAHSLSQRVVAEGVEDFDVLQRLRAMGCDAAQGFLIGHPVPIEQLNVIVDGHPAARRARLRTY